MLIAITHNMKHYLCDYKPTAFVLLFIAGFTGLISFTFTQDEDIIPAEDGSTGDITTNIVLEDSTLPFAEDTNVATQPPMFPQIKIVGGIIVQNREEFPYQVRNIYCLIWNNFTYNKDMSEKRTTKKQGKL